MRSDCVWLGQPRTADIARTRDAIFFARHKRWIAEEPPSTTMPCADRLVECCRISAVQRHLDSSDLLIEYVFTAAKAYALVITKSPGTVGGPRGSGPIDAAAGRFIAAIRGKQQAIRRG